MEVSDVLSSRFVALGQNLSSRDQVLELISKLASSSDALAGIPAPQIRAALSERETLASTALGNGVALPHSRIDSAGGFVAGVITTHRDVKFGSPDGSGTRIFAFVIGPTDDPSTHLEMLSNFSGFLRRQENRKALLKTDSTDHVIRLIEEFRSPGSSVLPDVGPNLKLLHVFTRSSDAFNDVMDVLASGGHCAAMIVNAERADSYLASIPVFAGFWDTEVNRFGRIVIAVVNEKLANQLLRKLEFTCGSDNSEDILITITDVQRAAGSLKSPNC